MVAQSAPSNTSQNTQWRHVQHMATGNKARLRGVNMTTMSALVPSKSNALGLGFTGNLGNIDAYISAVNRLPMLTHDEEISLATRLREKNDLAAAQELVLSHLRLVVSIARGYLGYGLPHADLIQEGNIGLMKAVKRFDPNQGVRLVSYAMHWIK